MILLLQKTTFADFLRKLDETRRVLKVQKVQLLTHLVFIFGRILNVQEKVFFSA